MSLFCGQGSYQPQRTLISFINKWPINTLTQAIHQSFLFQLYNHCPHNVEQFNCTSHPKHLLGPAPLFSQHCLRPGPF
uniref:Ovule protein n=1 Tax=Globodera rostochiensis TaxID=31243 RepID=A0A914HZA7_GLORO